MLPDGALENTLYIIYLCVCGVSTYARRGVVSTLLACRRGFTCQMRCLQRCVTHPARHFRFRMGLYNAAQLNASILSIYVVLGEYKSNFRNKKI